MAKDEDFQFDGTSKPINNTFINPLLTVAAIQLLNIRNFRKKLPGRTRYLTKNICARYGIDAHLSEANTMDFIRKHTDIPVPRIIYAFALGSQTYIVMQRIRGERLGVVWPELTEDARGRILNQLKNYVEVMRAIKPHEGFKGVANVIGGPLVDFRPPSTVDEFGPFDTIQGFHRFLRNGIKQSPDLDPAINEMIEFHEGPWPAPVFTHADLSSLNILVDGDEIVGIIDWEFSGWYPHYWEYTTVSQVNSYNSFWRTHIDKFLEPMLKELTMDRTRNVWFGDVG